MGRDLSRHCQPQGQIQLIYGAVRPPRGCPQGILTLCTGVKAQIITDGNAVVPPSCHSCEIGLCPLADSGGKPPLQGCGGLIHHILCQLQSLVVFLQPVDSLVESIQLSF